MKTLKYMFAVALGLTVTSCYDLDLEPKGLIYENVLFQSDNGIKKYLALMYQDLPIEVDGMVEIDGKHKRVVRHLVLLRQLGVELLMVMVGGIGHTTAFVTLIICWSSCLIIVILIKRKSIMHI